MQFDEFTTRFYESTAGLTYVRTDGWFAIRGPDSLIYIRRYFCQFSYLLFGILSWAFIALVEMPPSHLRSTLFVFFFSSCSRVFLSRLFFCLQITLLFDRVSKKRWYKPRICIFLYKFFCHFFLYLKHAMSNQRVHLFGYFRLQGLIRHGMLINPIIVLLWNHEMKTKTGEKNINALARTWQSAPSRFQTFLPYSTRYHDDYYVATHGIL